MKGFGRHVTPHLLCAIKSRSDDASPGREGDDRREGEKEVISMDREVLFLDDWEEKGRHRQTQESLDGREDPRGSKPRPTRHGTGPELWHGRLTGRGSRRSTFWSKQSSPHPPVFPSSRLRRGRGSPSWYNAKLFQAPPRNADEQATRRQTKQRRAQSQALVRDFANQRPIAMAELLAANQIVCPLLWLLS